MREPSGPMGGRFIRPKDLQVPDIAVDPRNAEVVQRIPLDAIRPAPWQPRRHFADAELDSLAASISEGLIHPVVVRRERDSAGRATGNYQLIVGERRWRAAQRNAARQEVTEPAIEARVLDVSDPVARRMTLVENEERVAKSPWEVALAYRTLREALQEGQATPVALPVLAGAAPHSEASISEYLKIADTVTEEVLREAGYVDGEGATDFAAISLLRRRVLLTAAKAPSHAVRVSLLREQQGARERRPRQVQAWSPAEREAHGYLQRLTVLTTQSEADAAGRQLSAAARSTVRRILAVATRAMQAPP